MSEQHTHFGYQQVPKAEKKKHVAAVFDSVAERYDVMNDLMSLGLHRVWKRLAVAMSHARPGMAVLDLASGTGDLARLLSQRVGPSGRVVSTDINGQMLNRGRDRQLNQGRAEHWQFAVADAEQLPFPNNSFDLVSMGFGLRNVTDQMRALASIYQVLKPGGAVYVLEFSRVDQPLLAKIYDRYSFGLLPRLGQWVANDAASYRYLAESIRKHPDQKTLQGMMQQVGFQQVRYTNMLAGVVALHQGYKC